MSTVDPVIAALVALCQSEGGHKIVAEEARVSSDNLWQIINGTLLPSGKPRGVGPDVRRRLTARYPGWLNSMESNTEPGPAVKSKSTYPVISMVQAGEWTELCDNFQPGDADDWRPSHKNLGRHGYMLRVVGKSMTGGEGAPYSFPEGMLLHVNPDLQPTPGQFVVVRRESEKQATFKRYVLVDGEHYLEALNPNWPNRYLKLQDGDQFCGVVVHAGFDMP